MKVVVDKERCVAAGLCVAVAGSVFDQNEDTGIVTLLTDSPAPEHHAAVEEAESLCPAMAITVGHDRS